MENTLINPYDLLQQYDTQAREVARALPRMKTGTPWLGLELEICKSSCFFPISGIIEILKVKSLTRVPRSAPWFLGVTNVRGRLVPVTDVEYWLTGQPSSAVKPRVFVVEQQGHLFGLYFTHVLGLRRLLSTEIKTEGVSPLPLLSPLLSQWLYNDEKSWPLIDFSQILSQDTFYQTAVAS